MINSFDKIGGPRSPGGHASFCAQPHERAELRLSEQLELIDERWQLCCSRRAHNWSCQWIQVAQHFARPEISRRRGAGPVGGVDGRETDDQFLYIRRGARADTKNTLAIMGPGRTSAPIKLQLPNAAPTSSHTANWIGRSQVVARVWTSACDCLPNPAQQQLDLELFYLPSLSRDH